MTCAAQTTQSMSSGWQVWSEELITASITCKDEAYPFILSLTVTSPASPNAQATPVDVEGHLQDIWLNISALMHVPGRSHLCFRHSLHHPSSWDANTDLDSCNLYYRILNYPLTKRKDSRCDPFLGFEFEEIRRGDQ
ncbi:hypothetical protein EVG20_g10657 [Dentipellis fragilis]|uniref:Uncharacterized protein n=1 Tax=Dentipellis fragilis TaxID=205917 RepID=A0A4Y9XS32_9AGAM|nr:hypothetical protein EVG20_g10657 [Dentipellis fragilis]